MYEEILERFKREFGDSAEGQYIDLKNDYAIAVTRPDGRRNAVRIGKKEFYKDFTKEQVDAFVDRFISQMREWFNRAD